MREAGAPSTKEVVAVLSVVCPPHRGYSWSDHRESRATLQGRRNAKTAPKWRNQVNSAAKGIIKVGVLAR